MTRTPRLLSLTAAAALAFALTGCSVFTSTATVVDTPPSTEITTPAPVSPVVTEAAPNTTYNPVHQKFTPEQITQVEQLALAHRDAVVLVSTEEGSQGTGFLIAPDIVITNHHVVAPWTGIGEPTEATIRTRDGRKIASTYIHGDDMIDFAAMRLATPITDITPLQWTTEAPQVGETVMYIGHPADVGAWFVGIGTMTAREYGVLLTTLPIDSGASGSPIMNMNGEVVAVASGIFDVQELRDLDSVVVHETVPAVEVTNAGGSEARTIITALEGQL